MIKFTIDRSKWIRGGYDGTATAAQSVLVNGHDQCCCLGQIGLQCNVPKDAMFDVELPSCVLLPDTGIDPAFRLLLAGRSDACYGIVSQIIHCNDQPYNDYELDFVGNDRNRLDAERELGLKRFAKSFGWELEFSN